MRILLSLIIPILLLVAPTVFQIVYTIKRIRTKTGLSLLAIFLLTVFLGLVLPFAATFISMYGLSYGNQPGERNCITGVEFFVFLGIGITIILTPLIGLTGVLIQYLKTKKQTLSHN